MPGQYSSDPAFTRRQILGTAAGALAFASQASADDKPKIRPALPKAKTSVRVAAVSYAMPFHDHRSGIDLTPLRDMTAKVAVERPDFICYPEICTCGGQGFEKGIEIAPELDPYVAEVGKIAREFDTAIVAPFIERYQDRVYNSVPIVNRRGEFVLVYRKNYPTTHELERGITPGTEVPVAECDGVRVGAAVCFDANFDNIAAQLEAGRARLVFWPSMYWGGEFLQHWAMRYGFAMAAAYGLESSIIDMNGEYLAQQGQDTFQVRRGNLPPWALADIQINRELYHLDFNMDHMMAIREKYAPDVTFEVHEPEGIFLMASHRSDLSVEDVATEFGLETMRDYIARSVKMRNDVLGV
ncbi:MAG: carbon-nitrogen hydrolase family protein [Planctomycetota bacterium]|nr:carbon-nitrogen hydrolase family protein [Planctomycetota bacterium]MDA1214569.1 carbon-nitrogen hydrolase family protein [Planctomycetota bacterium]